jgi:mRNA-degrading endonuclease RelE of RelBE toxin-antitoxin system
MEVLLHRIPQKYLERLNEPDKSHINKALKGLEKEPPEGYIVPVVGQLGCFRLTIGSYRALFRFRDDHIFVTHLDPRGQVYNKKNKGGKR